MYIPIGLLSGTKPWLRFNHIPDRLLDQLIRSLVPETAKEPPPFFNGYNFALR